MTPYACRRSFGPLILSNKNSFDSRLYSNCIKSVDQNCDSRHMASRDYLLYGPKIIPPCTQPYDSEEAVRIRLRQKFRMPMQNQMF